MLTTPQFNTRLLVLMIDSVYDAKYGTFLFNSERERVIHAVHLRTESLWDYVLENQHLFIDIKFKSNPKTLRVSPLYSIKIVLY